MNDLKELAIRAVLGGTTEQIGTDAPDVSGRYIVVADRGYVYVGTVERIAGGIRITDASCVRRWGTTAGLGQLALTGPTDETKLDKAGTVIVPTASIMHMIEVVSWK